MPASRAQVLVGARGPMKSRQLKGDVAIDLTTDDVTALSECIRSITPYWHVKFTKSRGPDAGSKGQRWGYLFWAGPTDDMVPVISVFRRASGYTFTVWDVIQYCNERA